MQEEDRTVQALIETAKESMQRSGLTEDYITALSCTWNALTEYLSVRKLLFTADTGAAFLHERYGIVLGQRYPQLPSTSKRHKRAVKVLVNCLEHETHITTKTYMLRNFAPRFEQAFSEFIDSRIRENLSMSCINRDIRCLNKFSGYLESSSVKSIDELESIHIMGFVRSMSVSKQLPSLGGAVSSLRLVLNYLHINQYLAADLSRYVPKVKTKPDGIPSVYSEDEVQRILGSIDRASPKGKRDYAMCLLAARLGMRASDICGLTFINLKWQTSTIEFLVKKTGKVAVLPLLNDVGEALIEYLRHGRPDSEDNHVFLRLQKPYGELLPSALHRIVSQSLRCAGIPLLPGRRQGPHSLRASLASAMLNQNTPLPVISEALTHSNTDTTRVYLKIDISHLRDYALDVPPLKNVWMGGAPR